MEHYMIIEKIEAYLKALENEERAAATVGAVKIYAQNCLQAPAE